MNLVVARRPLVVLGIALGAAYGMVATVIHLTMMRGALPAPSDSPLVIAVLLYILRAPFIAAIYFSTFVLGRNTPTLVELVVEALVFGALGGALLVWLLRRLMR